MNRQKYLVLLLVVMNASLSMNVCLAFPSTVEYHFYNDNLKRVTHKTSVQIRDLPLGHTKFKQRTEGEEGVIIDEFTLDDNFITHRWQRVVPDGGTDYSGQKRDHTLFIRGMLKGELVDKRVDLDDKPFYEMPRFNLSKFALSDAQNIEFWTLSRDRLVKKLMQAKKRGEETLLINGKETDTVKIFFSEFGAKEKYNARIFYFRKSDGLFVKKITSRGLMADLISER